MKKKLLFTYAISLFAIAVTGCKEVADDNPKFIGHEGAIQQDFLNEPALGTQYITLSEDVKNGTLHLTCSQPDFGYNALASYKVQVSLKEDFPDGEYIELKQEFYRCSEINPLNHNVAAAVEKLSGVQTNDDWQYFDIDKYQTVYVRLRAYITQTPDNSEFISNVVKFDNIRATYFAVWPVGEPSGLYLTGAMTLTNWSFDDARFELLNAEEEDTYVLADVPVAPGEEYAISKGTDFKVSAKGWASPNLGASASGVTVMPGDQYDTAESYRMVDGSGDNFTMGADFNGSVYVILSNNNYYVKCVEKTED